MAAANAKPWGEAIRSALAAEPDRWFTAVELVDRYAHLIPPEDIQRRVQQRKRHGSSSTDRAAASTIIGGVIYTGILRGHYERRLAPDGGLEVRATRTLIEGRPARRTRMLSEAGLMTVSEAAAVIGVCSDQVRTYVHRGLLPGTKFGNAWAVSADDVHAFERPSRESRLEGVLADAGMMTPAEAAAVIGVTTDQVRYYVHQGLLPGVKFENRWGIPAEDVYAFERPPPAFGDPRLMASLADAGLMTAAEAGAVIGVTRQSPPLYVQRGLLPGTKLANGMWVVPAGYVYGFKRPARARPLVQQRAWDCVLEGRPDPDNPHLYAYRGAVSRWSGDADAVTALLERHDVVVGGVHAAVVDGAQLHSRPDAAHVYVAEEAMNGCLSGGLVRGLVADPLGEVVVRAVATDSWQRLRRATRTEGGVSYAPGAAAALDMLLSPHPRERQAAEEFLGV